MLSIGWLWFEIDRLAQPQNFAFPVIPANAGIQDVKYFLDAPGSGPGQAYQVRHDASATGYRFTKMGLRGRFLR